MIPFLSCAKSLLFSVIKHLVVLADFHEIFQRMKPMDRLLFLIIHGLDRSGIKWHRFPVFLGLAYLSIRRHLHFKFSLMKVGKNSGGVGKNSGGVGFNPGDFPFRTDDGKYNDPSNEVAGSVNSFFGRNMPPLDQRKGLLKPNPMDVATKLLARKEFRDTGKQLNLIAVSWIQFMTHDWMDHLESTEQFELKASYENVTSQCPLNSFKFYKTKKVDTGLDDIKEGHLNTSTSWWDGSAIYGNNSSQLHEVRTYKDGKLKITNGLGTTGKFRNGWIGVSTLKDLFILEHNAVCDALKKEYPDLDEENLFRRARLVTSAVMAKIHTIDWTVELLKTDTLLAGMRGNWYGLLGKRFKDTFGHVGGLFLGGLVGLKKPNNRGVPYSMTEEFVSVYRLHPLVPDHLDIRDTDSSPGPNKSPKLSHKVDMVNLVGNKGENELSKIGFTTRMVSMGHQACGALELWNYPVWLMDIVTQNVDGTDRADHVNLASLEIYRDRERNVPRYNEFRRSLFLIPITKWNNLTDNKEVIATLNEVYGDDVEQLDLLVGLLAEKKIKGFALSETAFVIFLIMATRRLEADRFFTSDFNEEVYTRKGFEWVNTSESLKDVLDRHYPGMTSRWMNSTSAFTVWDAPPDPINPIPLYLRLPR